MQVVHCKNYLVKMTTSAWLLQFQGSLNRGGSMIKGIPKHNYHPSTPSQFHLASDTCLLANMSVHMHPSVGYYPVQNRIIASRWMHMNWYTLASRQVSLKLDGL